MAKKATTTITKAVTKEVTNNEHVNIVTIEGIIKKVIYANENVASYSLETHKTSPKGNTIKSWVTIKEFKPSLHYEVGDHVIINNGELATDSYEKDGKKVYNTVVVGTIEGVDADDEIPFN